MLNNKNNKKIQVIDIQENLKKSFFTILFDVSNVGKGDGDLYSLRRQLEKNRSKLKIYKNKLIEKALFFSNYLNKNLVFQVKESNSLIFCFNNQNTKDNNDSEYNTLNILLEFNKEHNLIDNRFRAAINQTNLIDGNTLNKWANLPNRLILVGRLCNYLNWQLIRLINVLNDLFKQK